MKKIVAYTIGLLVILGCLASAQVADKEAKPIKGWKKSLAIDFTTTQAAYSNSWVGGDVGSMNWVGNLNGTAERQFSPKVNYSTKLRLSFGQTMTQDEETKDWSKPRKSTDLIDWDNLVRFTLNGYVDPYGAFRVEGQFLDASVQRKKFYLSPLRLTQSAGIARRFWSRGESEEVTSRLGFAFREYLHKEVVFEDMADSTSMILGSKSDNSTDGGIESVTDVIVQVNDKLQYTGKLTLFKALFFSKKDEVKGTPAEDYWKSVDVNWENTVDANLTKIVTVKFYVQLLYDKQIDLRSRIKETLGIGFVFTLW